MLPKLKHFYFQKGGFWMRIDWKAQIKSYSFWLSVASACLLLLQAVGKPLGLNVNEEYYMSIVNAVLGVFVLFGIIAPTAVSVDEQNDNNKDDDNTKDNINEFEILDDTILPFDNKKDDSFIDKK